jgi:anti-anti-sigma factor
MSSGMTIRTSTWEGSVPVTVFHIQGEIDSKTYEQFEDRARQAYETGMRNLLLDLSEVTYISSAGLRALHSIFSMLRTTAPAESDEAINQGLRDGTFKSPHLKLLSPTPDVLHVLKVAGFDMYLEVHHDLKEAVASF